MQRRGNLPLIILSFQIPTGKVVIPKVDRHEMAMRVSMYLAINIVAISRDDIFILLSFPRVSQLILNSLTTQTTHNLALRPFGR